MPLIFCPVCRHVTYAYHQFDSEGVITGYRCSQCYNVFNHDQINIMPFPNEEIIINTTFRKLIAEVDRVSEDEITEEGNELAERVLACILFLARPEEVRVYHKGLKWLVFYAPWDYRGTREADENNEVLMEKAMQKFAEAVDRYYHVVEVREMDKGDSIFFAVHPDDVNKIHYALKRFLLR